jgi:uncharacterized LabA/DUF88 family protein
MGAETGPGSGAAAGRLPLLQGVMSAWVRTVVVDSDASVAVYWDFENVHACLVDEERGEGAYRAARYKPQEPLVDIDPVVEYAATFGRLVVHRAYGNWQYFARYRDELQAHAVDLIQLFPLTGWKNGADIRLVLDVAEDLQQAHVTHVIVVASDSDYTSLAQRCRKQGRVFIGIGTTRTVSSYRFACDEFRRYRDLALATASPVEPEPADAAQEPASLEDAAELVTKAVRRLAAGRGEAWALKAAVRPLVKRLDPTFDERRFGFSSFTEMLKALDGYIAERVGENDHELAVRADVSGPGGVAGPAPAGSAAAGAVLGGPVLAAAGLASTAPVALVERQLRRRGLRLPAERQVMWIVPEIVARVVPLSGTGIEPGFDSLRLKIEPGVSACGLELSEVDFNKLKGILWRARVFELHGHDKGISLRLQDVRQLRLRLITVLLEHLADPESEDPAVLAEAFYGPGATGDQRQLILEALQIALAERNQPEDHGPDPAAAPGAGAEAGPETGTDTGAEASPEPSGG